MFDSYRVPLVQVVAQLEVLVDRIPEVPFPHLPQELRQVVYDQPVLVGEELGPHFRNLPAGDVGVEAVEEGRVDHCVGKWREEVARLHESIDGLVDVADENHRSVGIDGITASGERPRGHVVLHDLDAVVVLE